jgi:hypothetical protein
MGLLLLPAGCSCQANHRGNGMATSLGGGRRLDRSFCRRPDFTVSWPHNSAMRRTRCPSLELHFLGPRPRRDRSCSKPHHLSGGLDRDWAWYGRRTLRRGVRDARADLSRQDKKPNYDAYFVRRVFEHHLLAAQRFACFIGWVAVCVFHLCWSAACGEFADLLATLAAKY